MAADRITVLLEHLHDVRLVRSLEAQKCSVTKSDFDQLGDCVLRIPPHGARESLGQLRLFSDAVEDYPGSRDANGILRIRDYVFR